MVNKDQIWPLSTFEHIYIVPAQKVCFLTIDITADPNLIVLGCIWNILRYKYNVYQMPTFRVQHTNWIGSEKVVSGLHFDWNLYLQVSAVDSYTEVFHSGETSFLPYIMLLTPISGWIIKGISEFFEELFEVCLRFRTAEDKVTELCEDSRLPARFWDLIVVWDIFPALLPNLNYSMW